MPHANYLSASLAVLCGACFIAIPMAPSLVTEELDTAQMAFMADDECRERDCALAALQLRSSLDTVMESTAINAASMPSDDRTAYAEAQTRNGAWKPTTPVTSNARSTANSSSSPLSNVTATSAGNSTPNASSEADSGADPPAGDHAASNATARRLAPSTPPPAAAGSANGSSTRNSSAQASGNESGKTTRNETGRASDISTPNETLIPPNGTNGSATGNSSNGSAGDDRGNGTEAANTTGTPCSTCALYDPSSRGLDWTDIEAPCYNLAQTQAMIEDGTWCCEEFISESMKAHPTSCFTAPNKGSWPCYSPDKLACS